MAQLVFVHGVSGPRSTDPTDEAFRKYEADTFRRDDRFVRTVFAGEAVVDSPIWSIYAAHPAWNLACVPHAVLKRESGVEALGIADGLGIGGLVPGRAEPLDFTATALVQLARADLDAVIGSLSAAALEETPDGKTAAFWTAVAEALQDDILRADVLRAATDRQFLDLLQLHARKRQANLALGLFDGKLAEAALRISGGITDLLNAPAVLGIRNAVTPKLAIFVGDVFVYLHQAGPREKIRNTILSSILKASRAAKETNDRLILCGHSMGGVILYDLLSDRSVVDHLSEALGDTFQADLFLSVGSQIALFEEMKVFTFRDEAFSAASGRKAPLPVGAARWWNVYNRLDVLSFLAEPVFEGVCDLEASTTAGVKDAHSAYFDNMMFYTRLKRRLGRAGLLP